MISGSSKPMREKLKKHVLDPQTGCWLWTGTKDKDGYGRMRGSVAGVPWFKFAHRAAYEEYVGGIPEGLCVLHHCDTPSCINPEHLYAGTPLDNGRDKASRGRARSNPEAVRKWNLANSQPKSKITGKFIPRV